MLLSCDAVFCYKNQERFQNGQEAKLGNTVEFSQKIKICYMGRKRL